MEVAEHAVVVEVQVELLLNAIGRWWTCIRLRMRLESAVRVMIASPTLD